MNIRNFILIFLSLCFICSCNNGNEVRKETKQVFVHSSKKPKTIHVYFFEGFNETLGKNTIEQLKQVFDSVVFEGNLPYPDSAYYAPRNRYKADKLVKHLRKLQGNKSELVIGFSPRDIADKVHGYDDYGVMGWTRISLHSSVVSAYRLKDKSRQQKDFLKLVLHELGHADGLPHCKHSNSCYMKDANKKNHFPGLNGFCSHCESHLKKKNWNL